jgi:hypothetical protein
MNITQEDMKLLEGGLKELLSPSPREARPSNVSTRKRSFDEVYASMRPKKQKIQSSQKREQKLSYEEEQKIAEQKWLESRGEMLAGYSTKIWSKPYVSFSPK